MPADVEAQKRAAAEAAVALVKEGDVVGLGTGSTAKHAILQLGAMVRGGFDIRGVPTSIATANLAKEHGIPLTSLEECPELDLVIDGADEVDPRLDASKLVKRLGSRVPVPVEVHPFGWKVSKARLEALGGVPELRLAGGATYRTDNDNYILDTRFSAIRDPAALERDVNNVPGVLENGLFVRVATVVFVADAKGVKARRR
jgi:ribose 5-phosphate isomerase A